jgi:hypothetical protein
MNSRTFKLICINHFVMDNIKLERGVVKMTDIQYGSNKKANRENKRNDIDRPSGKQNDKRTKERYENFDGKPIE